VSLFNVYDGPGPVKRQPVTEDVIGPQVAAMVRDAHAAPGLYRVHLSPVADPQIQAFTYAPSVDWAIDLEIDAGMFGEVTYD